MKGKIDIIASLTPPSIHDVWLNLNDNKLYRYGTSGWMSLIDNRKPGQSGGSTNLAVQSDWLANKPVLPEYIKNKTHYLEVINTYNEPGTYDFPISWPKSSLKFAIIQDIGEDIIVDIPSDNYVVNINEYIMVRVFGTQFILQETLLGALTFTPLKIVVINKHLNESYLPENIKADFMQPDETKQSFIRNNPFFNWRQITMLSKDVGNIARVRLMYEAPVIVSNGNSFVTLFPKEKFQLLDNWGEYLAHMVHTGTGLEIVPDMAGVFWIAQANSVANWDALDGEIGYIANKPFNKGLKISGSIGGRLSFSSTVDSFNHDTLRLRYEGKYYRLPYLTRTPVNIDNAFSITFIGNAVSGNLQIYNYATQNIKSEGRDQTFTIESNIGATELCDLNIPNTIARNWKISNIAIDNDVFLLRPTNLENHTYYRISDPSYTLFGVQEIGPTTGDLQEVLEVKFFIPKAGSEERPFYFAKKGVVYWEEGFPELTGQTVEITLRYLSYALVLGSVKVYEPVAS